MRKCELTNHNLSDLRQHVWDNEVSTVSSTPVLDSCLDQRLVTTYRGEQRTQVEAITELLKAGKFSLLMQSQKESMETWM